MVLELVQLYLHADQNLLHLLERFFMSEMFFSAKVIAYFDPLLEPKDLMT